MSHVPNDMKTFVFDRQSQRRLEYRAAPRPTARDHQIVVKIQASSLNPHDWKYYEALRHIYRLPIPLPSLSIGHDLSGTVVAAGRHANRFKVGDEVFAMSMKPGAFGQYLSLDHRMAARKPKNIGHHEAAALPMVSLTAWQSFLLVKLRAGERVLVVGGSGGVGAHAIQIAKARGAHVTSVSSTANVALVTALGAEGVIDYTREDVLESGSRFDVILDTVGTLTPRTAKLILAPGGRFITLVTSPGNIFSAVVSRLPGVPLPNTSTLLALPLGRHLEDIGRLVEAGSLRPVIDREYPIEDLEAAIAFSKTGRSRGKIVLAIS